MNRPHKENRMSHAKPIPGAITGPGSLEDKVGTIPNTVTAPKETGNVSSSVPGAGTSPACTESGTKR